MSTIEPGSQTVHPAVPPGALSPALRHPNFWIRELPFTVVLLLTLGGVAYTSYSKQPIEGYWEILAPVIALVCIGYGWREANDKMARLRLVATQAAHWIAFLVVMNLLLLTSVQRVFTSSAAGIAIFTLLALGTFTAGVHVLSWQVCLLGLIMALGIPAIAWIENSALIVFLIVGVVAGSPRWCGGISASAARTAELCPGTGVGRNGAARIFPKLGRRPTPDACVRDARVSPYPPEVVRGAALRTDQKNHRGGQR